MAPAAAGACRALAHTTCSTSGGPAPGAGSHRAAAVQPRRARPRESRRLSTAAAPGGRGGRSGSRGGSGAGSSSSDDDLQQLRGLGPVGEAKLREKFITTLPDLFKLYHRECGGDAQALAKFLVRGSCACCCSAPDGC